MGAANHESVKFRLPHLSKADWQSLAVQTSIELAVGALLTALLLRWLQS
jgi:hypothetical protein